MTAPATSTQPNADELAELDALAGQLNRLGFPSLVLTPPGKPPCADTGLPQGMTPGERVYAQAGMYFWCTAAPIAPTGAAIRRALQPGTPQP